MTHRKHSKDLAKKRKRPGQESCLAHFASNDPRPFALQLQAPNASGHVRCHIVFFWCFHFFQALLGKTSIPIDGTYHFERLQTTTYLVSLNSPRRGSLVLGQVLTWHFGRHGSDRGDGKIQRLTGSKNNVGRKHIHDIYTFFMTYIINCLVVCLECVPNGLPKTKIQRVCLVLIVDFLFIFIYYLIHEVNFEKCFFDMACLQGQRL